MTRLRVRLPDLIVFVLIAAGFSLAAYKTNTSAINDVRRAQAAAQAAGAKVGHVCHRDINAINQAHTAIRQGFLLEQRIAQDNITAITTGLHRGLIPLSLRSYYLRARARQVGNRDQFHALAASITQLAPIC